MKFFYKNYIMQKFFYLLSLIWKISYWDFYTIEAVFLPEYMLLPLSMYLRVRTQTLNQLLYYKKLIAKTLMNLWRTNQLPLICKKKLKTFVQCIKHCAKLSIITCISDCLLIIYRLKTSEVISTNCTKFVTKLLSFW